MASTTELDQKDGIVEIEPKDALAELQNGSSPVLIDTREPHEYAEKFPAYLEDPALRRRNIFAYIDVRDLGRMVERCLEVDGLGYQVFNVANADLSVAATTDELRAQFYDDVELRREMGPDETFYAIDKARSLLDWEPHHSWRDVLEDPRA